MNDLERLIARANITETKARYCQMLDKKNVGGLRAVFTENATLDASESVSIKNHETGAYDRPLGDAKRKGNRVIDEFNIDSVHGFRTRTEERREGKEGVRTRREGRGTSKIK